MHTEKNDAWHKIADSESALAFAANGIAVVELWGKKICIAAWNGKLHAFAYKCPHAGGLLSEGSIDSRGRVVCPTHGYKFSLQTGRDTAGEGYFMRCWTVEKRADGIYIALDGNLLTGGLI